MKKKKVVIAIICILVLWVAIGIVDYSRVNSFERPLFCVCTEPMQNGGSGSYVGLGYSFDIEGNFMPDTENPGVTKWTYYLFGIEIQTQKGDNNTQHFFSAKVIEVDEAYLLLEVFDTGNSNLSEGAKVEVSTDVVSADGCPEFVVGEYARVLMARNTDDNPPGRFEALSIYKTDETGKVTAD